MRLQELYIKDYKVLQDFTLTFDEESAVSVLIGENGSGKTTVVECLTLIFAELFRQSTVSDLYKSTFPFEFRLRYRLFIGPYFTFSNGTESGYDDDVMLSYFDVTLSYFDKLSVHLLSVSDEIFDTPDLITKFLREQDTGIRPVRYLFPASVAIYYSGISTILYKIFDEYQNKMILNTIEDDLRVNQDLFYFQPKNFPILLIGLLSFQYGDVPQQLATNFQIENVDAFDRIVIKVTRPKWAKPRSQSNDFWAAKGDLANFLAVLHNHTSTEYGKGSITFSIVSPTQLVNLWSYYGTEKSLFEYLVTLQANGLIESIDVYLRKNRDLIVHHQRLSEGEKQLLTIMAMRELLAAENTLFLLDEPDTYLHPEWKQRFTADFMRESIVSRFSHSIITTHSPGIVSGMRKNQLHILRKVDGRSESKVFSFNPYGKPEDDILFDFFGLTGLRFKPVEYQLDELQRLISQGEYDSKTFKDLYELVESQVGKNDKGLIRLKFEVARRKRAAQPE